MRSVADAELVGRDAELAQLEAVLGRTLAGRCHFVLLSGEQGIGKTRLLEAVIERARTRGFRVLRGAGHELERDRPFGPLVDALGVAYRDLSGPLRPEGPMLLPGAQTPDLRYRAIESLLERVEEATMGGAALLVLDDLQWADPATLVAVRRLVAELPYSPLAVVGAARPTPRPVELSILLEEVEREGALGLELRSLDEEDLVRLAETVLGGLPGPKLRGMLRTTGGNPFIAHEILAAARSDGLVESDGVLDVRTGDIPEAVRLVVLQRLSRLSSEAQQLLRMASILGPSFSPSSLSLFLARPASDLAPLIDEALRSGELVPDDDRVAFRHDIVRDAVYRDMPEAVRPALHLQAARNLAAAGAPAVSVAAHYTLGAIPGDPEAIEWLRRAAREAQASDPLAAAALLGRAVDLEPEPGVLAEVRRELLSALIWAGRPDTAIALGEDLLNAGSGDPITEGRIRIALGTAFEAQALWDGARRQFEAIAEAEVPELDRALVLAHRAHMALPAGDVAGAAEAAEEARRVAGGRPSLALTVALHVLILLADAEARWGELSDLIADAETAQDADPTGEARLWPVRQLGVLLCRADRIPEADVVLRRGLAIAEEIGLPVALHGMLAALAWKELYAGRLDEAATQAETALGLGQENRARSAVVLCLAILARVSIHRGSLDRAEEMLQTIIEEMARHPLQYQAQMAMWARGLLAEARNDASEAHAALASAVDLVVGLRWEGEVRDLGPDAVRLALANGDRERAAMVVSILERLAEREGLASVRGAALQCRGLLEEEPDLLVDAVEAWRSSGRALDLARAREDAATTLSTRGRSGEARSLLEEAVAVYETAGAARDVARCERALRQLGVSRGSRGPRQRPSSGWDALTEAEARVVELATQGLTNPQIADRLYVSRHTVKTHLGHAFRKLGLSSRLELAREFARRS